MNLPTLPVFPMEIWHMILQRTNDHWTLRGTYLACRDFADYYETDKGRGRKILINYRSRKLVKLLENPDYPWDWRLLSESRKIPMEFKETNDHLPWIWRRVSLYNCTWDVISRNAHRDLNWYYLSSNSNLPWEFVLEHIDYRWDWEYFSILKSFESLEDLFAISPYKLRWCSISSRNDITEQFVEKYESYIKFDYLHIGEISWEFVEKYIHHSWNWNKLTSYADFPIRLIIDYTPAKLRRISFHHLSRRDDISFSVLGELIKKYMPDNATLYVIRKEIDWNWLEKNLNIQWNWKILQRQSGFPSIWIDKYPDIPWHYKFIMSDDYIEHVDLNKYDDFGRLSKFIAGNY